MNKTIEIARITAKGNTIKYKIEDNTGLHLLKKDIVEAWVKYHHAEDFNFAVEKLPESILVLPAALYLIPVTWFYGVELIIPSIDKVLYDNLPTIYETYSKIYGPFKQEWKGNVMAKEVVENKMPESHYESIVFFSGGVDAVHAGINNPGEKNVLVSVPSIESVQRTKEENSGEEFNVTKSSLIRDFSLVSGSNWLLITNNFLIDVFNDTKIQNELKNNFQLNSEAFRFDGWFGIKYLGNLLSAAPFAYAMGIKRLVMGSTFEQLEDNCQSNLDGASPELSNSFKIAAISFEEQDGLYVRRTQKVMNIVNWCLDHGKYTKLWTCFGDSTVQCGVCRKCIRTQLNILCSGENPQKWGFEKFDEKEFTHLIRSYGYNEQNPCWLWDIIDTIDNNKVYPYCNELLHWLKKIGYKKYARNEKIARIIKKVLKISRYPHYVKVLTKRFFQK